MDTKWSTLKIQKIFDTFGSSAQGLTQSNVENNRNKHGENVFDKKKKITLFSIFLSQFKSAFIYILIFAAIIVFALGEYIDGSIVLFIIILNAIIGTLQEGKAQNTLEALQSTIVGHATVLRDGKPKIILDKDVVPGDILILKEGDAVTADARIVDSNNLKVSESALTGESASIIKKGGKLSGENIQIADQNSMVFRGTYVVSGFGQAVVVETGRNTAIGSIAKQLDELKSEVPLKQNIKNLSKIIIISVSVLSAFIFTMGIINGQSVSEMFITIVAIAVSAIPESLPVVVTLVLATGVFRMSKKNVLVKRLQAVEALGQADVLALDKTGTITKNQMAVVELYTDGKVYTVTGDGYNPVGEILYENEKIVPMTNEAIIHCAHVSSVTATSDIVFNDENKEWERITGDPTEAALKVFGSKLGLAKEDLIKHYEILYEIPFDFETKHHTTINDMGGEERLFTAGSPEVIMDASNTIYKDGKVVPITKEHKQELKQVLKEFSNKRYRVLALAIDFKPKKDRSKIDPKNMEGLTFIGFSAIEDAIRPEVPQAVLNAQNSGMKVVMITGDHKETAEAFAKKVGIYKDNDLIFTGADMDKLDDIEIIDALDDVSVFARVSPQHKLRIIKLYKEKGKIIAMTGDGINDALSLTAANLGVSMGKIGTEVAKEASDIILLDDNFANITAAAEEGRNIYQTIRKSVLYLLSTNLAEIMVLTIAVLLALPLPLLASQILWLNMITDTFLVIALALDPKENNRLKEKFQKPSEWMVDRAMGIRIILMGGVITAGTLVLFVHYLPHGYVKALTVSLTVLTVYQWYNIFNVRSNSQSMFKQNIFSNLYLVGGLILAILLHLFAVYTPFMQKILHTTALNITDWIIIITVALSIVLVEEVRKLIVRVRASKKQVYTDIESV